MLCRLALNLQSSCLPSSVTVSVHHHSQLWVVYKNNKKFPPTASCLQNLYHMLLLKPHNSMRGDGDWPRLIVCSAAAADITKPMARVNTVKVTVCPEYYKCV